MKAYYLITNSYVIIRQTMSFDLASDRIWWMGHSCDGSSGCWHGALRYPSWKGLERARRLLGKSLVYRLRGHAEVAASHFSGPRANIASAPSPAAFLPCTWLLRWSSYLCFSTARCFVTFWKSEFWVCDFEFCASRFICYLCHRLVFFLQRSRIWEWEKDCSVRLSDSSLSVH